MLVDGGGAAAQDYAGIDPGLAGRLAALVVARAQVWAAELDAAEQDIVEELPAPVTAEQVAQRDLRDAVHDLEFHSATGVRREVR